MSVAILRLKQAVRQLGRIPYKRLSLLPLGTVVAIISVWTAAGYRHYNLEEEARVAAYNRGAAINLTFAQFNERMLRTRDLTTKAVSFLHAQKTATPLVDDFIGSVLNQPGSNAGIVIADTKGHVRYPANAANLPSIANQTFFQKHLRQSEDELLINTAATSHNSKTPTIVLSRRLSDQEGHFDGVVAMYLDAQEFLPLSTGAALGEHGFLTVLDYSGNCLAVQTGSRKAHGPCANIPGITAGSVGQEYIQQTNFPDERDRFTTWQPVAGYPLMTVVGVDAQDVLSPVRKQQRLMARIAAWASVALSLLGFGGTIALAILGHRRRRADAAQQAYRTASEGTQDGFFILEAVRDVNERIINFVFVDFNSQAARMLGFHDRPLQQALLTDVIPGEFGQRLVEGYCRLMVHNEVTDLPEVFVPEDGPLQNKWLSYRAAPFENGVSVTLRDITETKNHRATNDWQETHDALTRLFNRRGFHIKMPEILTYAAQSKAQVALFLIDLDDFKTVNDTAGHTAGDYLLQRISDRLARIVYSNDYIFRLGADEFALAITGHFDRRKLTDIALQIQQTLAEPVLIDERRVSIGASIGIGVYPDEAIDTSQLLKYADLAMSYAKESGKRQHCFFEPDLYIQADRRLELEGELRVALERDELFLVYQPKIDLQTKQVVGMEALLRWRSPTRGFVSPVDFIPVAEKSGLILPIGNFVISRACAQIEAWKREGKQPLPISVNISPKQLRKGDLVDVLVRELAIYKVPAHLLQVELTESCMMDDVESSMQQMRAIKAHGIKILVDDFGTGYSSLALLKKFEVDVLKVDRSFVKDIPMDTEGCAILDAIISMAKALHMEVVAEGVETLEQSSFLQQLGCSACQGFYYSKPIPAHEMALQLADKVA